MEQEIAPDDLASMVEGDEEDSDVRFITEQNNGRIEFHYEGAVYAHRLPDEYRVVGLGSGWFSLRKDRR